MKNTNADEDNNGEATSLFKQSSVEYPVDDKKKTTINVGIILCYRCYTRFLLLATHQRVTRHQRSITSAKCWMHIYTTDRRYEN